MSKLLDFMNHLSNAMAEAEAERNNYDSANQSYTETEKEMNFDKLPPQIQELERLVRSDDRYDRIKAVRRGYGLDVLKYDKSWMVRLAVAERGYDLDLLSHDEDLSVRNEALRQLELLRS